MLAPPRIRAMLMAASNRRQPTLKRHSYAFFGVEAGGAESDDTDTDETITHFGFQSVPLQEKQGRVREVFDSVAEDYDVMNDVMSGTVHRTWKDSFVRLLDPGCLVGHSPAPTTNDPISCSTPTHHRDGSGIDTSPHILDVAGGTGDIAFRICDAIAAERQQRGCYHGTPPVNVQVTVCDINTSMLAVGQRRSDERDADAERQLRDWDGTRVSFMEGNAEELVDVADCSVDAYTIAFGIRNVTDIPKALRTAHRVLRPGGRFMCLEFSRVSNPVLRALYQTYSFHAIPPLGQLVAGDRDSYQYLVESIQRFPDQQRFAQMVREAGFSHVTHTDMTFGVVAVHSGFKL